MSGGRNGATCSLGIALFSRAAIVVSLLMVYNDCGTYWSGVVNAIVLAPI